MRGLIYIWSGYTYEELKSMNNQRINNIFGYLWNDQEMD